MHTYMLLMWVEFRLKETFSKRMIKRNEMNEMPKGFSLFYLFSWYIFGVLSPSPTFPFYFFCGFFACLIKSERYCVLPPHLLSLKQTHATPHTHSTNICWYSTASKKGVEVNEKGYQKEVNPFLFDGQLNRKNESISISQ